jgi:TonB-linked SusC/RagA family outer membrane protein
LYGPLQFSNGMYGTFLTGSLFDSGYRKNNTTSIYSQLSVEQDIPFIPGLKLKGTIAYDPTIIGEKLWIKPVQRASIDTTQRPYLIKDGIFGQTKSSLNHRIDHSHQLTYQAGLNYTRSFGKSTVSALGIFEAKANNQYFLSATRRNFNLSVDEIAMGSSSQADMSTGGSSSLGRQMGLVYRVTYDYADKYLFEASGRYDGSYYFAPDQRFGFFPAFSVGWRLSEEDFMKNKLAWLDNLKLRASYGEVGALAGSPFQYLSTYSVLGTDYVIGKNAVQGIRERAESNPNITWERAKKTDVGVEATLWKGLLNIEADYFYEKRSNMLMNPDVVVPAEYGIGLSQVNAGIMDNRGIDLSVSSTRRLSKDLSVSLGGTFTYAKNKLLKVFESAVTYDNPNRRQTGRSLGTRFGFKDQGYFQVNDFDDAGNLKPGIAIQPWGKVQPGDIRYQDLNGDGKINDDDLAAIGDPASTPRIIYGISPSVRYKGLSLDLLFQGTARVNWYYHPSTIMPFWDTMLPYTHNFDYWTPENPNASNPRLTSSPTVNNSQTSSFWMGKAGYLRLKNATLGYNLPSAVTQKIRMQHVRVYVSGQNILTWTKLLNYDPEIGPNNSFLPNGSWSYPQQKVVSIGLNVTF